VRHARLTPIYGYPQHPVIGTLYQRSGITSILRNVNLLGRRGGDVPSKGVFGAIIS
jgi:hypothetical protein